MRNESAFNRSWYENSPPPWWAKMLSLVFIFISTARRALYHIGVLRRHHPGVPVIVIGNIVAGGAGKTPLAIAVISVLQESGLRVGVVSRGYGGRVGKVPVLVSAGTPATQVGDEPLLIARRTGAPVSVHPRRYRAALALIENHDVDVVLCDDGLQHYALQRDIEIAVVDGARGLGNGRRLPAGPLREPASRLASVDHVVINGVLSRVAANTLPAKIPDDACRMQLRPAALVNLRTGERRAPDALAGTSCAAIAGIGNPQRFFETLGELGYQAECRAFEDHHAYNAVELEFADGRSLLMTEKDAVKCQSFAADNWWYLEINAVLEPALVDALLARLAVLGTLWWKEQAE